MNGVYAFLYSGAGQDSLCKFVLVKCFSVEDNLFVAVSDDNDKEALQYEIRVSDYVTTSDGTNYAHLYKRLNELVEQLNTFFLSKLPSSKDKASVSRKESHEDVGTEENIVQPSVSTSHPAPSVSGIRLPPVPDFGRSDLLPGAGAGVFPSSIGGPGVTPGVGGMLVGPHDPRWGGMGFGEIPGLPEGDRGIVPPGARYDPIGPPGIPGFEPGRFGRSRRPPSGGVNPDLEHFKPF
ncbi:hypothetical protein KP509_1Z026600 [Ceratopteris richardii]|nr:hypothetical protein KP509_1Z026600 [Ceratopteris richardii]